MVLPYNNFVANSDGEAFVYSFFQRVLPEEYVSFHNYSVKYRQADVILLVQGKGVLIIEIKGFRASSIIGVPDDSTILLKNQLAENSPYKQALSYRFILIDELLKPSGIESVYVVPAVCYPYISEAEYQAKGLNKISPREITILQEDFADGEKFLGKISSVFDFAYCFIRGARLQPNCFFPDLRDKVGNLISPDFRNQKASDVTADDDHQTNKKKERVNYSRVIYTMDGKRFSDELINQLVADWFTGTKIQLYTSSYQFAERVTDAFKKAIEDHHFPEEPSEIYKDFSLADGRGFRIEIKLVSDTASDFELDNGDNISAYEERLQWLDAHSAFNYGQYMMEHAPLKNVIVKAGAGTGKTYSLISRINYLLWKEKVTPETLPGFLVMITFTNESANQMKRDLAVNFLKFFQLTRDPVFLRFIEHIEDTHISTIDSLARAILSKFSIKLGYGVNFRIVSGSYERSILLRQNLNHFLSNAPGYFRASMSMFHFEQRLSQLLDKTDNKNIDLSDDIDFGGGSKRLPNGIIKVLKDTQAQLSDQMHEDNAICLGDLIRKLKSLASRIAPSELPQEAKIKYLFVDEFQDTDDIQIELIRAFQRKMGFRYFVVGDTKQCIYRFRGAEVQAFRTLTDGTEPNEIFEVALRKNYRTDKVLLNRMNDIFSAWDKDRDLEYHGNDVLTGTIERCSVPRMFYLPAGRTGPDEKQLIAIIRETLVRAEENKGQVAILVRYNYDVQKIRDLCNRAGINISTEVGGELFSTDPTIDLYKLLMALRYNRSSMCLYNLYTTSFVTRKMPKYEIYGHSGEELVEKFNEDPPVPNWQKRLDELRSEPILKVLQTIIHETKPWDTFAKKVSPNDKEGQVRNQRYYLRNLDQLFENLVKVSNTDYLTINKLTDYLEIMIVTKQEENAREPFGVEGGNSRLLCTTVHKAKGAEYDTVILPFCDFDISGTKDHGNADVIYENGKFGYRILDENRKEVFVNDLYAGYQKDEAISRRHEETRILYVALTRAKREVYCFISDKKGVTWGSKLREGRSCES